MSKAPTYLTANGGAVSIGEAFFTVDDTGAVAGHLLHDVVQLGAPFARETYAVPASRFLIRDSVCYKTQAGAEAAAVHYARYRLDSLRSELASAERLLERYGELNQPPAAESAVDEPVSVG